jgi:cytochrome c
MQKSLSALLLLLVATAAFAQAPDENRFEKVVLSQGLNEPLEMAVLPDERVLVIERHGLIKLYDPKTKKMSVIATIPVSTKYNPDSKGVQAEAEDGLLGLTIDPAFATNGWIYLYYSPAGKTPMNVLARYKMIGNKIDLASKKIVIEIPVQRDECCHTGGSMGWDANGNLFLSTGDNTSPRASDGYAPIDERPGRTPFDAQRSSGNTNDLRGKVIRIHPEATGAYTIPEGNLFAKGTELTKPEIYTMGHRNPYRITVDKKTGYLFWGDVGPDSGKDSVGLGPTAEDEFNVAKAPGNFGWPYFVGDNKAYWDFDFETKKSGDKFIAEQPVNNSVNNTGLKELPPAQKAMIYYPAGSSNRFPLLGSGGRSAMAGPVYHIEEFPNAKRAFPGYYDNKWFIYEWMRDWIIVVTMNDKGNYSRMERFLPNLKLDHPIDMTFGPNGDLYLLEYGQGWFMENPESKLVRIEYNGGNRKPMVVASASASAGATPLSVKFSSEGTKDYDNDQLAYEWKVINAAGAAVATINEANPSYEFKAPGNYKVKLKVTDAQGLSDTKDFSISAGNEPPMVSLSLNGSNQSFFFPNQKIAYEVKVSDKEDGSLDDKKILPTSVRITANYQDGDGSATPVSSHQEAPVTFIAGKSIIAKSDCKACHFEDKKSIGPSFNDVAAKYKPTASNIDLLSGKIIKGGAGVWGDVAMAPHPDIGLPEAKQIVQYILSLSSVKKTEPTLPAKGEVTVKVPDGVDPTKGVYRISASYKDKGYNGVKSITSEQTLILRNPTLMFGNADDASPNIMRFKMGDNNLLIVTAGNTFANFRKIDMTGIRNLYFTVIAPVEQLNSQGGVIEVHTGSAEGPLIGQTEFIPPSNEPVASMMSKGVLPPPHKVSVNATGYHDLYFVFKNDKSAGALFVPLSITFSAE